MLNEAGEKWIFRVKYGWRDLAALMKLRRQSVLAVSAHLHMHGNASAIHQRSTHSVSVHERARMILLNSQGDEERPFKVIRGVWVGGGCVAKYCIAALVCVCVCECLRVTD